MKKIQLTYNCQQDWGAMKPTDNGRYCSMCKKEVFDFTNKTKKEFLIQLEKDENLCGNFNMEQIDNSLIKPIVLPRKVKYLAFLSTLSLLITSTNSFGQKKAPISTVQNYSKNNATTDTCNSIKIRKRISQVYADKKPMFSTKRKTYYWSKNFPFIVGVIRQQLRGNIRYL
jgi:hypothetical protein